MIRGAVATVDPVEMRIAVTPALRDEIATIWDSLGGQSLLDTELALAAEREENAMLRARVEVCEEEVTKFQSWFLDVTGSFTKLSEQNNEIMHEKSVVSEKYRKERLAHADTKAELIELKARVAALEMGVSLTPSLPSVSEESLKE